jgi:hypothetical protein
VTWVHEDELTDGHRAALARARRISAARARAAAYHRHGVELPAELVQLLEGLTGPIPPRRDVSEMST